MHVWLNVPELLERYGSAQLGHAKVAPYEVRDILDTQGFNDIFSMVANELQALCQCRIIGDAHAAFAGLDMLMIVQAKHTNMPYRTGVLSLCHRGQWRLGIVLD